MKIPRSLLILLLLVFAIQVPDAASQDLDEFEDRVTEFTLDNGLSFIVIERHVAPVVSFASFVDVGSANEPAGHTGIAHIFEHMAFKGTNYIGTNNWKKEQKVLQQLDDTYRQWLLEKHSTTPDSAKMDELWNQFKKLQEEAKQYVVNNEFSQIIERNGGTELNATTGADETRYFYSLPSNRVELWFSLESDRFKNPVFREFYKEKKVVREERRMRTESSPQGRLFEEFQSVAYTAHPYGNPIIGWHSDITATTMQDARTFYDTYYVPSNITIAVAGDVDPDRIRELANSYFGDMETAEPAPPVVTEEPEQRGERRFVIEEQSQPFLAMGFHTVNQEHPDSDALSLLGSILSDGRTSRLHKRMVEDEQTALGVGAFTGWPGDKYESMFTILAVPNRAYDTDTLEATILDEIEKVKNGDLTQEELDRARTNERAGLIRSLDNNMGLALNFVEAEAQMGDWRHVFNRLETLNEITLEDLQRVAKKYLVKENRTVGKIKHVQSGDKEMAQAN